MDNDYQHFLFEIGLTQESVDAALRAVVIDPTPCGNLFVAKSEIAGNGMFAASKIAAGEVAATISVEGRWTVAGRYTNHSKEPNVVAKKNGTELSIVALRDIAKNEEITANYRQVKQEMERA